MNSETISGLYKRVINAQETHARFIDSTEKNISYYLFGKFVSLTDKLTYGQINLVEALNNYTSESYNPLNYLVDSFIDEISNSDFRTRVNPYPVRTKEPYQSYADQFEDYLEEVHITSERKKFLRAAIFSILSQGYFATYTNGKRYWFLTPYDFFPGDSKIANIEDQPFVVRKTNIRRSVLGKIPGLDYQGGPYSTMGDLDIVPILDVWSKPLDLNVCFTGTGQVLYKQKFPHPKDKYPFSVGLDLHILNSFYPKPMLSYMIPHLLKYQAGITNVEESSKSIANPILTYDADAGIDVNMLQRALKEGYKRIIVGKNREGKLNFIAPGQLPNYAITMPNIQVSEMMNHLGITEGFLGKQVGGVRESGAMGKLLRTAFRKLGASAAIVETCFTDLDNYLLDYMKEHQLKFKSKTNFKNLEEVFGGPVRYRAEEKFKGFSSEDATQSQNMALLKFRQKMIPQRQALTELGYNQPRKLMEEMRGETADTQKMIAELKSQENVPPKGLLDDVAERLKGRLRNAFSLMPIADNKVVVKCAEEDQKVVAFLLTDLTESVMVETIKKVPVPPQQESPEVVPPAPPAPPVAPQAPGQAPQQVQAPAPANAPKGEGQESIPRIVPPPVDDPRGRPVSAPGVEKPATPDQAVNSLLKKKAQVEETSTPFSESMMKNLIAKSISIKRPEKYFDLPGFYVVEPHARWIHSGKKLLLLKSKKLDAVKNKPHLLLGRDKVYGVITVREILDDFDVNATGKYHLVSPSQAKKWWGDSKLYLYMFEYHPFPEPIDYKRPEGVQTFVPKVNITDKTIGLPFTGDLKPMTLSPNKIPPAHRSEKEAFTIDKLNEMIPEASYDVASKTNGLLSYLWVADGNATMYSDTGSKRVETRLKPILDFAEKKFKHDVLLVGEFVMKGKDKKEMTGYLHASTEPTKEQLDSLRFACWDILYIKNQSVAAKSFLKRSQLLDLYCPYKAGLDYPVQRVKHEIAKDRAAVLPAIKRVSSNDGAVVRDINSAYWATHTTYDVSN